MKAVERRAAGLRERIAARLGALPGVAAHVEGERIMIEGRGLERRRMAEPALRWIGGWLR